jgi:hypothetical protein
MSTPVPHVLVNWTRKQSFEDYALNLNPAMYLRFGEAVGDTAYDRWGGHPGTISGCTLAQTGLMSEDPGTCFRFTSASSNYVSVPDHAHLDLGDTFWFACVFKRASTGAQTLADKGTTSWQVGLNASGYPILAKTGTATIVTGTTAVTDTTTAHLLVVRKVTTSSTIFLDGVDITGAVTNQTIVDNATALNIGRLAAGSGYLNAYVQEVLYGSTLSDTQAFGLYVAFSQGEFSGPLDDITSRVKEVSVSRGRNADFSGEAMSSMTLALKDNDQFFLADRNLCPNPSAASGIDGWLPGSGAYCVAPTRLYAINDPATGGGTWSVRIVGSGVQYSGAYMLVEGTFYAGVSYACSIAVKSISGSLDIRFGLANWGTPGDEGYNAGPITTSWVTRTLTWTPAATATSACFYIRCGTAAAATWEVDCIQINAGTVANTYIEAPTRPYLSAGAMVRLYGTYSATNYPKFTGITERISPSPKQYETSLTCYGMERVLDVPVTVASTTNAVRDHRSRILDAAWRTRMTWTAPGANLCTNPSFGAGVTDWEHGQRNLCSSPSDLTGWSAAGDAFTTAATLGGGFPSGQVIGGDVGDGCFFAITGTFRSGHKYRLGVTIPISGTVDTVTVGIGSQGTSADKAETIGTKGTRISVTWTPYGDRADAHVYIKMPAATGTILWNSVRVTPFTVVVPDTFYADYYVPGGPAVYECNTFTRVSTDGGITGTSCEVVTYATVGSGIKARYTATVPSGGTVTASCLVWTASGSAAVTLGLGDEVSTTDFATKAITATTTKQRYVLSWTTTAIRSLPLFYAAATAASAITFRISDLRFEVGIPMTPFEPLETSGLSIAEQDSVTYAVTNASAFDALTTLCKGVGTRHWIESTMTRPFWKYVTSARSRIDTQAVAETITTPQDIVGIERDGQAIANQVKCGSVTITDTDTTRVRRLGGLHAVTIGDAGVVLASSAQTDYATRYCARYKLPRMRPKMQLVNQYPTQVARQLDDLIAVTSARSALYQARFLIGSEQLTVVPAWGSSGAHWTSTLGLEEAP